MKVEGIQTPVFNQGENLHNFIAAVLGKNGGLKDGDVLCITSKIVSLAEGATVARADLDAYVGKPGATKKDLVQKEADVYLADGPYDVSLTIKHGIMIPSAGIDESNSQDGAFILYPKDPYQSARLIWEFLRAEFEIENLGVVLTDSHTQPLRRGVVGIALSYWGFRGVKNYIGHKDLFGRELKYTAVHVADSIAASAVFIMGEANECVPLVRVNALQLEFTKDMNPLEGQIEPENDLYYSLYQTHRASSEGSNL